MGGWGEVIGGPRVWARDLGLAVAIGVALAFIGPYGSYDLPLERRLVTSVAFGLSGSAVFWPSVRLGLMLGTRAGFPQLFTIVLSLAFAAAPTAVVVMLVRPLLGARNAATFGTMYFAILAMAIPLGMAVLLVGRWAANPPDAAPAAAEPAPDAPPRLLARLPKRLGSEVLALQAEDHYVRVHTARGSDLILMRLADAIAEADRIEGLRVHRSWWVAKAAVASAKAEGRRAVLTLTTGLEVPVTRDAIPDIRRAGWL